MLTRGYKCPKIKPFNGKKVEPCSETLKIPPLLGMIIFGCIARNFFGDYMDNYNNQWGVYIRMGCLSIVLLEGGMDLEFDHEGSLKVIILMTLIPFLCEAALVTGSSMWLMSIPFKIAITLGFQMGTVSPAILVPAVDALAHLGYGVAKAIPTVCVAAASFNDIIAITIFRIAKSIAFSGVSKEGEEAGEELNILHFVIHVII